MPLGNQLVDEIEHIYYSWNAPTKGGPQLKSLPPTGQAAKAPASRRAAWPPRIKPVFAHPLPRRGGLEADRPARRRAARRCW